LNTNATIIKSGVPGRDCTISIMTLPNQLTLGGHTLSIFGVSITAPMLLAGFRLTNIYSGGQDNVMITNFGYTGGDMTKAIYDADDDGIVSYAAALKLGASTLSYTDVNNHITNTSNPHTVTAAQVGNGTAQWNANKIQGADITAPVVGDDQLYPKYDHASGDFVYDTAAPIQKTGTDLASGSWVLSGGIYEYDLTDSDITADTIVDAIPINDDRAVVMAAQVLPYTSSSLGHVKFYAINAPSGNIEIVMNLTKKKP